MNPKTNCIIQISTDSKKWQSLDLKLGLSKKKKGTSAFVCRIQPRVEFLHVKRKFTRSISFCSHNPHYFLAGAIFVYNMQIFFPPIFSLLSRPLPVFSPVYSRRWKKRILGFMSCSCIYPAISWRFKVLYQIIFTKFMCINMHRLWYTFKGLFKNYMENKGWVYSQ